MPKIYLGDAVYADLTEYGEVILTTEDGIQKTNVIVMDGSVLAHFEMWLKEIRNGYNQS